MNGPLSHIRVLDFSTLLPGPYATMLLADMGAEVVRVESPTRLDLLRITPPMKDDRSYAHLAINRSKYSLGVDLKSPDAAQLIKDIVSEFDVVIEQFRPGVMERLGLDYKSLSAAHPGIVYCSLTGYGQTGPLSQRAGHDINYLALSGLASYSGRRDTGPVLSATQIADLAGGSHHAVMAIQAALLSRTQTGKGQHLDISMSDAAMSLNGMFGAAALATGQDPGLGNTVLNGATHYDYYLTKDNEYLAVGSLEPQFAAALLQGLGHQEWLPRLVGSDLSDVKADIAACIATQSLSYWQEVFDPIDACVDPVLSVNQAATHPHFLARGMVKSIALEDGQTIPIIASALPSAERSEPQRAGVRPGQDSREILSNCGLDVSRIDALINAGCVHQA